MFDASAEHTENTCVVAWWQTLEFGVPPLAEAAAMRGRASRERTQLGTFACANPSNR
jgi:hypothetical protein